VPLYVRPVSVDGEASALPLQGRWRYLVLAVHVSRRRPRLYRPKPGRAAVRGLRPSISASGSLPRASRGHVSGPRPGWPVRALLRRGARLRGAARLVSRPAGAGAPPAAGAALSCPLGHARGPRQTPVVG